MFLFDIPPVYDVITYMKYKEAFALAVIFLVTNFILHLSETIPIYIIIYRLMYIWLI